MINGTAAVVAEECSKAERLDDTLVERWMEHRNDVSALHDLTQKGFALDTMEVAGPWGTATVYPLPFLETLRVRGVELLARVEGLADLVVANTDGEVGSGGPFPVFGATPAVGLFLELRSVELFLNRDNVKQVQVAFVPEEVRP